MKRTILAGLAMSLLLPVCAPAFAGDTLASPTGATAPATPAKKTKTATPDDVICRNVLETGSRLGGHRTCMTRQQWNDQSTAARSALSGGHPDGYTPGR